MRLMYFNTQKRAWCFHENNKLYLLSEGASLYNVDFIILLETRNDIVRRMSLGVPKPEAMNSYPHAFMGAQLMNHQTTFPKKIELQEREVVYCFEKGIFHYVDTEEPINWAEYVLLTSDFRIYV